MLSMLLGTALAAAAPQWHDGLDWHGVHVGMSRESDGTYTLAWPYGQRTIRPQPLKVHTASVLFDGLFAMAQDDLAQDSVDEIRDGAFDHGRPIPCECFETGLKWPYVWTRDLSYSIDLGLWRYDATRSRNGLLFKLSEGRAPAAGTGPFVMQDTGSGGSWPISTDRVVWFLGAQHLLDDKGFADATYRALGATLAQDRRYAFDAAFGLYRGETSFLDWREQSYPAWTANEVVFIAQSFALSTNVLHFEALQLAGRLAEARHDPAAADYRAQAASLRKAIDAHFWRADRGLYMSYIGGDGTPFETYDLLGTALAVTSGVAQGDRASQALAHYPTWPAGSPVIWPERADQPVYHNRAIWPFVSAYAMRAARVTRQPGRLAHEIASIMRGAALSGSNMENYELLTQGVHVDLGPLSGPVVNSPRQLWSVAAYLAAVTEGVFGLEADGRVEPRLPVSLVSMLFGDRQAITLDLGERRITLVRPASLDGNLLVADRSERHGAEQRVTLQAVRVQDPPLRTDAPLHAPVAPPAPRVERDGDGWRVLVDGAVQLYVDGRRLGPAEGELRLPHRPGPVCISATRVDAHGLESLHSPATCVGAISTLAGAGPYAWTAPAEGRYRLAVDYANPNGPINTGITAAVKTMIVQCAQAEPQRVPLVMPHSVARQRSTWGEFTAPAGAKCQFRFEDGFNMSYLAHFAHYTGGSGGSEGPLNRADVHALVITAAGADKP